jgi:hypothetical protein
MEGLMDTQESGGEETKTVEAVQDLVSQNLDKVEAQIDSPGDSAKEAVHELRVQAQEAADRTLTSFRGVWRRMQDKLDTQMEQHPWLILGSPLVLGYFLNRSRGSRRRA